MIVRGLSHKCSSARPVKSVALRMKKGKLAAAMVIVITLALILFIIFWFSLKKKLGVIIP